jgi:hypothetical protein
MDAFPLDFRLTCRRGVGALLLIAPLVLVLVLIARRLAGALVEPLPLAGWLSIALVVALWLRWFDGWLAEKPAAPAERWLASVWLAPVMALVAALVLWLPGTRVIAPISFIAIVALGGAGSNLLGRLLARPASRPARIPISLGDDTSPTDLSESHSDAEVDEESEVGSSLAPAIIQQLVRRREPGETESLRGSLRTEFAVGQRTASAHVAICPPFESAPRCQAAVAAGPAAEVRVATALPFGVRFEIKLAQAAIEPGSVVVEFAIDSTDSKQV